MSPREEKTVSAMPSKALAEIMDDPLRTTDEREAARYELGARGFLKADPSPPIERAAPAVPSYRPPAKDPDAGALWGCALIPATAALWLIYALAYAPRHQVTPPNWPSKCDIWTALDAAYPGTYPLVERMGAENVDIYMTRGEFESIPYPDRKDALKAIGRTWDPFTRWYYFSSVQFRDIHSGKVMASYSCNTGGVDLKGD